MRIIVAAFDQLPTARVSTVDIMPHTHRPITSSIGTISFMISHQGHSRNEIAFVHQPVHTRHHKENIVNGTLTPTLPLTYNPPTHPPTYLPTHTRTNTYIRVHVCMPSFVGVKWSKRYSVLEDVAQPIFLVRRPINFAYDSISTAAMKFASMQ
ncbi:hypothetical protein EGR_03679 [Echinococcus granulosus]|uniref:Uncharacterized protein n=1 Tax=Echinococcus granulosus TaxID=6210 RepID=W6V554_ECHGR|nr:hypothetical protein EGR_03679 [Echinococcus granulosus]EUB61389.1 hypothetical protein EGR_03679 [Echinococcus granulosus]